jgi:hypothetical protein
VKGMKYYVEISELPRLNIEKAMKAVENYLKELEISNRVFVTKLKV